MPMETAEWNVKLPPSQNAVVETIIQQLRQTHREQRLPIIQLVGGRFPQQATNSPTCSRLVRDYELLPETSETFIYLANRLTMIRIMAR